jgi:leader peptidase (prepilin peptidase) / N-methyltransferase
MDVTIEGIRNGVVVSVCGFIGCWTSLKIADLAWVRESGADVEGNELRVGLCVGAGATLAALYQTHGFDVLFWKFCVFDLAMFLIAYINQKTVLVPNLLTLPLIGVGLLQSTITPPGFFSSLIATTVGGAALWLVAWVYWQLRRIEGIGMGIVKLVAVIGAWLGWQLGAVAVLLGFFAGGLSAIWISAREPVTKDITVGIHFAVGAAVATVFGQQLFDWYMP